jgi:hypothetical protein
MYKQFIASYQDIELNLKYTTYKLRMHFTSKATDSKQLKIRRLLLNSATADMAHGSLDIELMKYIVYLTKKYDLFTLMSHGQQQLNAAIQAQKRNKQKYTFAEAQFNIIFDKIYVKKLNK